MSSPAPGPSLTDAEVERFVEDGFVRLDDVVAPAVLAAGREVIWSDLAVSPHDRSTWPAPVARLLPSDPAPFRAAFDSPRLAAAFDQLVGTGRWMDRPHLGLFVVRFPHSEVPDDTGWHIDVSFAPDPPAAGSGAPAPDGFDFSRWRVNVASRGRGLLMLFLYCDVGPDDAPTRIRVGSHLDVPAVVAPSGPGGLDQEALGAPVVRASASRPEAVATGGAGAVYLCHPFLVHAAQAVRGTAPRLLAQPPLDIRAPFALDGTDDDVPVAAAIRRGLGAAGPRP